ncbi:hypothetical protein D9C73_022232 [Collichthys lucidus]|uniref:CxC3 like cysteine cluster domain-containing protein n=1 Tax=Collichthys lucidus TaxID=240159 RepID=A0A4U5VIQ9_COLLU|nr:hypothetical protein D9C73_022232 [Collichthys lucidus]
MNHLDPDDAIFLVDAFLDECKKGFSRSVSTVQDHNQVLESLIQDVRDLLGSGAEQPLPSHWRNRQTSSLENWTVMRPFMVNNMLSSEKPKEGVCHHCGNKAAVVMCKDCLPRSLYCTACDLSTHEALVLHNRASMSGKICGDTMQRAFLEWAYAKFEVDKLSQVQHFQCPACTPSMLAVAVDGNRKLYRFKSQPGSDGFFDGVFLANDAEVSSFVDYIHGTTGHTVQRITEATKDLEKLTTELSLQQDTVHQWVSDVQQWTSGATIQNDLQRTIEGLYLGIKQRKFQLYRQSGGNKQRHQLRRKIAVEKKALEVAINEHNAAVGEVEKLFPPNELMAVDNYSWPWECHCDMERKKFFLDKVMLLARLKEEELIVVREVKQHMEYMRSIAGLIEELTFQLTEDTNRKSQTTSRNFRKMLRILDSSKHDKLRHVSTQSLYMTDEANVALFPGASGVFSSLDLTPRARYEGHGEVTTSAPNITGQRFTFMRSPATSTASSPACRIQPPEPLSPKHFKGNLKVTC